MLQEIFIAVFKAGLPVAVASYLLVWWALRHGYLEGVVSVNEVEKELKRLSGEQKGRKKKKAARAAEAADALAPGRKLNPVHNKWLKFGGGFYGVVALLTYIVVELGEIRDFFRQFDGISGLFSNISFDLLIGFFIDSITNFVVAVSWPIYWMSDVAGEHIWIWFAVAYGGYWAGARYALHRAGFTGVAED